MKNIEMSRKSRKIIDNSNLPFSHDNKMIIIINEFMPSSALNLAPDWLTQNH